ncbi:MAG: Holliday junction branch migration protein RuvA [Propionibacteriaceae bacterium]|jgi:Holliday junction DNA helicase RuvA|nr:Holliday junction branch migration protein RuvA [Propionibacteriaceae bacterium]
MIATISGEVIAVDATSVVVSVSGIGFHVSVTPQVITRASVGVALTLHTSLVVRADALTLYGFESTAERKMFELLLTASGVGPRTALAALAVFTPADLITAIRAQNPVVLTKIAGIGHKGAQKIVIELQEKVLALGLADSGERVSGDEVWREQVVSGLQNLGWNQRDAQNAVEQVAHLAVDHGVGEVMRAALQTLARR